MEKYFFCLPQMCIGIAYHMHIHIRVFMCISITRRVREKLIKYDARARAYLRITAYY